MSEERNQYAVVPFDTFERYLGPRYENIPGVEYILENGTLLYFMEEAPGVYESGDHTVTGAPAAPKLFVPVGPREQFAAITDFSVTIGLSGVNQRKEPGYVLDNGLVLLESERDSQGNYKAGAGMEGMFLQTGRIFEPIRYPDGEILAFLECQPERTRAKDREAEKTSDTVKALEHREEKRPQKPPSLREQLRRAQEARPLPGASVPERER